MADNEDGFALLEARVARLEAQFTRIENLLGAQDDRLRALQITCAEMSGRITNLPTIWAMISTVIGGQAVIASVIFGALHYILRH
jgi:hypothetical protein